MNKLSSLRISEPNLPEYKKVEQRQDLVKDICGDLPNLFSKNNLPESVGQKNCENWLGSISIPVGVAGPLTLNFQNDSSEYYLPLATTEGALVASISRGAKVISQAGGAGVIVKKMGMSRAPVFECQTGQQALETLDSIRENITEIINVAEATSNHLRYINHHGWVRGKFLYIRFNFDTDQAMGMNMVTIASQAISRWIEKRYTGVSLTALSSNVCTDKKDNFINSILGRGYWTQAEIVLSKEIIKSVLRTNPEELIKVHTQKNLIGSNLAGSFSQNAHVANVLSAIYLATGQDPAHVVEGSKAFLSLSHDQDGLYVSLTLPNINMGTVGGGTYLPAQSEARFLIGQKELTTEELVAVTAGACLAGELSLLASFCTDDLAKAHQSLGRYKNINSK
ncbi:MAG: hydroxymethylglutaryl-CoA reductase [Candidatus Pacebacteria bacterium]|nr:hydroxymethylglutaryl-CoA reductase [Candidatus Paceibacterota bacterium]